MAFSQIFRRAVPAAPPPQSASHIALPAVQHKAEPARRTRAGHTARRAALSGGGRIKPQTHPRAADSGRYGRKGSPYSYERCQPPYTSTNGSEDRPLRGPRKSAAFVGRGRTNGVERMFPAGGRSEAKFVLTRRQGPFLFPQKKKRFLPCGGAANPLRRDAGPPNRMESGQTAPAGQTPLRRQAQILNRTPLTWTGWRCYSVLTA